MRTAALALLLLCAPFVRAQGLLHELASPNEQEGGFFGWSVAGVSDLDGDGRSDLLVGAYNEVLSAGRAYVFSGATGELLHTLSSPNPEPYGFFGIAVAGVADLDGDGEGDVIVGASGEGDGGDLHSGPGRAYVFSGATGALLHTLVSPHPEARGAFGSAVAGVPDLDGDGVADLLVGAQLDDPGSSPRDAGRTYVFSGATGVLLHELASPHEEREGLFGTAVAGVGDLDGDGAGDIVVGAWGEAPGDSPPGAGRAYVFSGATGTPLYALASPNEEELGYFGTSVAGVADLDGDEAGDVVVGADHEGVGGRAYVYSGATGALLHALVSPHAQSLGSFGDAVSGVSDLDDDGVGDLLVGAYGESVGDSLDYAGRIYAFSGATGTLLYELASPHEEDRGHFGDAVAGVPDADGDGRGDVMVGAYGEDGGAENAGRAYLFSGAGKGTAVEGGAPLAGFALAAYPNPLTDAATLAFTLPEAGAARLAVYDALGREVAVLLDGSAGAGRHEAVLEGAGLPAGVYLVRLTAGDAVATRTFTVRR